jgi:hypothetical protein
MSGFTLYETLRIFLPGALGVFVLDLTLRFAFGPNPAAADGGVQALLDAIESPLVGVFVAVFIGLALYLLDLPSKSRLYREGDPARGIQVPSAVLSNLMKESPLGAFPKNLSLYFLLSDRYLPDELHKRIYLFGSLYRVYVDMRALLAFATVAGIGAGLAAASNRSDVNGLSIDSTSALAIGVLVLSLFAVGSSAIFSYAHNVRAKHQAGEVAKRLRHEASRISFICGVLLVVGVTAVVLLASGEAVLFVAGGALALCTLTLWSWVEIGPPGGLGSSDVRSTILARLGGRADAVQYLPLQRLLCDARLFIPWLLGAAVLSERIGASGAALLSWGIMVLPCTAIMGIRKHEVRLLASFGDQALWLELHADDITTIRDTRKLPDSWT